MYWVTRSRQKGKQASSSLFVLLALLVLATPTSAQQFFDQQEPLKTGFALHIDNDLFAGNDLDKDYTGGMAVTFSGRQAVTSSFSVDKVRSRLDRLTRFNRLYNSNQTLKQHALEAGFALFTPSDLSIEAPQLEEHPYASLFFLANSQQVVVPNRQMAFSSVFIIGALGLDLAEDVHASTHDATGSSPPKGWDNQISSGGELTARYSLGVQKLVAQTRLPFNLRSELKLAAEGNIGFTTGAGVGFSARIGRIHTPWWGFNPQQSEYVSQGSPIAKNYSGRNSSDLFLYFGANVSHQFYNAILQGQFKDSAVTYSSDEINSLNTELWVGVSHQATRSWNVGGFIRSKSAELKNADGDALWGGLTISRLM